MIAAAQSSSPPRHLVLGAFGFDAVTKRMGQRLDEVCSQRELTLSADLPSG
jgi:hypothetical protein